MNDKRRSTRLARQNQPDRYRLLFAARVKTPIVCRMNPGESHQPPAAQDTHVANRENCAAALRFLARRVYLQGLWRNRPDE